MTDLVETDMAWLSGLWDGEGSVGISPSRSQVSLQLAMTHEGTVRRVHELLTGLGCRSHVYTRAGTRKHHKQVWMIHLNRMLDALTVAEALEPFSVTKREHWRSIHDYASSRLSRVDIEASGRIRRGGFFRPKPLTDEEQALVVLLGSLNHRGRVIAAHG